MLIWCTTWCVANRFCSFRHFPLRINHSLLGVALDYISFYGNWLQLVCFELVQVFHLITSNISIKMWIKHKFFSIFSKNAWSSLLNALNYEISHSKFIFTRRLPQTNSRYFWSYRSGLDHLLCCPFVFYRLVLCCVSAVTVEMQYSHLKSRTRTSQISVCI